MRLVGKTRTWFLMACVNDMSHYIDCHSPSDKTAESSALSTGMCTSNIGYSHVMQTVGNNSTVD